MKKINKWVVRVFVVVMLLAQLVPLHQVAANEPTTDETTVESVATNETTVQPNATETSAEHPTGEALITSDELPPVTTVESEVEENKATTPTDVVLEKTPETPVETPVESEVQTSKSEQPTLSETTATTPTDVVLEKTPETPVETSVESKVQTPQSEQPTLSETTTTTPTDVVLEKTPETPVETLTKSEVQTSKSEQPTLAEVEKGLNEIATPMPVVASAQPAQAGSPRGPKPIDNVITGIKIEREDGGSLNSVPIWTLLKTSFTFALPNNVVKGGDYTIITLPDGFDTNSFPPFDIFDSNGKKIARVTTERTAGSPSLDIVTLTYYDTVETLSDITGSFYFRMRVDHEYVQTQQPVDTTFKIGNNINITADPNNIGFDGITHTPQILNKSGWFIENSANTIQYRIIINQPKSSTGEGQVFPNLVIEDNLDPVLINLAKIDPTTMQVYKGKWVYNASGSSMYLQNETIVTPPIQYNPEHTGFKMTIGDVGKDDGYAIYYKVKLNYDASDGEVFENTAIFKSTIMEDYIDLTKVKHIAAGGTAMGYIFKIKIVKTNDSGAPLPDAEFKVVRDRTGVEIGRFTTGPDGTVTVPGLLKDAYTIEETRAPLGYQLNTTKFNVTENDFDSTLVAVVNVTNKRAETEVCGQKHWQDGNNQDGLRPNSITVILKANGEVKQEKVVTAADNWSYKFSKLPTTTDAGVPITYTVDEKPVPGYTKTINNHDITNTHTPEVITISGQKHWEDENNQDGVRPAQITVILKADGVVKEEKVVTATDNWAYTFSNLPKYRDQGVVIVYTIEEKPVDDYQTGYNPDNYDIVNLHTPEVIEISGQKEWVDNNNQDGVRPTEITVILKADGVVKEEKVVKATDNWSYTFSNLPKYRDQGVLIVYTIDEKPVDDYQTGYNPNNYDIVNVHTPEVIEISGQKHWEDNNNQDGVRPTEITVILKADGVVKEEKVVTVTDNWSYTFSNLPKYRDQGVLIVYTVEEKPVDDYQTGYNPNNYDIVNVHTPEVIEISGQKHWEDNNNQDGVRPAQITVILKADDVVKEEKVVTATDNWSYTFSNLPKYRDQGVAIVYTIEEKPVTNYEVEVNGYDLVNKHTPEVIEISGQKHWEDNNNQDGVRPTEIIVILKANGEVVAEKVVKAEDGWKYTFENLPKFKAGKEIVYTIEEKPVDDYQTGYNPNNYDIVNVHTPEVIEISGQKHWEDNNNQDGVRPTEITVILKADGVVKEEKVVTATDNWSYTFSNLPKYRDQGVLVVYTVEEKPVANYEVEVNGFDLVNKHTPEVIEISGQKHWEDNNNQDGVRPTEIIVILKANGEVVAEKVVKAEDGWKYTFENLPKFKAGKEIVYTIEEKPVANYEVEVNGFDLVNKHTPEVIEISGQKHWEDNNNQDGVRPTEIIVILKANGEVVTSKEVKAEDGWKYTFENLPKFKAGKEIVYTIEEKAVDGYTSVIKAGQFDITNTHKPEMVEIGVEKVWQDEQNKDGSRPQTITVVLLANGEKVAGKTIELSASVNWKGVFGNLPKYKDGQVIKYSVEEVNVPKGYKAVVTENGTYQFIITNSHTPELPNTGMSHGAEVGLLALGCLLVGVVLIRKRKSN